MYLNQDPFLPFPFSAQHDRKFTQPSANKNIGIPLPLDLIKDYHVTLKVAGCKYF